ncbi:MAG: tail fiber protein [Mucilaginibacter sp.]|uniref:phage tail protein n=1 Tax=Mucilaginibacter sp. TaxID=1882438 RepID=UPI003265BB01
MDSPFIGQIQSFGFNYPPRGWMLCQGQTMSISQYTTLFALIGTTYGGDGVQTFVLPDLRGRVAIAQGHGPGLSNYVIGQVTGTESINILQANLPAHTHVATFTPSGGGGGTPLTATLNVVNAAGTAVLAGATGTSYLAGAHGLGSAAGIYATTGTTTALNPGSITVSGSAGGGGTVINALAGNNIPIPILQPYLAINYSIAMEGLFPSRN